MLKTSFFRIAATWTLLTVFVSSGAFLVFHFFTSSLALENGDSAPNSSPTSMSQAAILRLVDSNTKFDTAREVDLGVVSPKESVNVTFAIPNSTQKPLTVLEVQNSCSCEVLELQTGTVIPSQHTLLFTYGIPAWTTGAKIGNVFVSTDSEAPSLQRIRFTLAATVQAEFVPHPNSIAFRRITRSMPSSLLKNGD